MSMTDLSTGPDDDLTAEREHCEAVANDFFWKRDLAIAHGTERPSLADLIQRERAAARGKSPAVTE